VFCISHFGDSSEFERPFCLDERLIIYPYVILERIFEVQKANR
jgi:hypothetical protein